MPDSDIAQFTSVFRTGQRNRPKRNRQPVSCIACQRRKAKCDKRQPCGACEKRGDGDGCRYGSAAGNSTTGTGVGQGSKQEVQLRLSKLEELIKGLAGSPSELSGQVTINSAPNDDAPVGAIAASDRGLPAGSAEGLDYHGATSWTAVVDSIHDIQHLLQADDGSDNSRNEPDTPDEADPFLGSAQPITISEAHSNLPPRRAADKLIACYFTNKYLAIPFIHTRQFRRKYEAFWTAPESVGFFWTSIIFSIISAGAFIAKVRYAYDQALLQSIDEPRHYLQLSARCLIAGQYLNGKAGCVEALLQHTHARNMQRVDADHVIWALYGLAVRLAQRQGYHRDPSKVEGRRMTAFQAEMRRRVWFMVQTTDLLFSFQTGMPPMVSEGVVDTDHPTNLLDEDFDEDSPSLPPARGDADPTPILAYIAKSQLTVTLRRVMLHALAVEPPPFEATMRLNAELDEWYAAMPACLRIRSIRETAFTDANYTIMHRIMLELMYLKCLCVLHRPYLSVRGEDNGDAAHAASRDICRGAALRMLDMHIELDWEVSPGGRMHEERYMVSNLTLQHFLLASTVVCVDLSESRSLSPEERAHRKGVLKKALDIWTSRSSYSSDARHATRVLRAVLSKVDSPAPSTAQASSNNGISSLSSSASPATNDQISGTAHMPSGFGAGMAMDFRNAAAAAPSTTQHDMQQGTYPSFTPGTTFTDAQFPLNLEEVPDLDTLLYSTEALNWNSIDQYLKLDNTADYSWTSMLQGL